MNIHAPKSAKIRFPAWEFRGKPFKRCGKVWIKVKSKIFYLSWYYSFDDDEIYDTIREKWD